MEEVGMHNIAHYVEVWRQTIASFIVNHTVSDFCVEGERKRGSSSCQFWWEQPMDLDAAREAATAPSGVATSDELFGGFYFDTSSFLHST
ncbi:hypothetical protein ACHAXR_003856 [Thalassiosira sp. AJA248-18]